MLVEHLSDREKNDLIFILTLRAILSLPTGKIFIAHKKFINIDRNSNKKIIILVSRSQVILGNFLGGFYDDVDYCGNLQCIFMIKQRIVVNLFSRDHIKLT